MRTPVTTRSTLRASLALVAVAATAAGTFGLAPSSTAKPPTGSSSAQAKVFMVNPVQSSGNQDLTDDEGREVRGAPHRSTRRCR